MVATYPPNLVWIGQTVKTWQVFFEIQYGGSAISAFGYCAFLHIVWVLSRIRKSPTKCNESLSNIEDLVTVFKIKMAAATILNYGHGAIFTRHMLPKSASLHSHKMW